MCKWRWARVLSDMLCEAVLSVADLFRGEFYLAPVEHATGELLPWRRSAWRSPSGGTGAARRHRRRGAIDEDTAAKLSGDAQRGEAAQALHHVAALTDEVSENANVYVDPVPRVIIVRDCKRGVAATG